MTEESFNLWDGSRIRRVEMAARIPRRPKLDRWRSKASGSELIEIQSIDDEIEALLRRRRAIVKDIWRR